MVVYSAAAAMLAAVLARLAVEAGVAHRWHRFVAPKET
jgi:hypothetical protein